MEVDDFVKVIINFFYIVIILICIGIVWSVWARLKGDLHTGGFTQVFLTILKLGVVALIGYYLVQYGKDSGFFNEVAKALHPGGH